MKKYKNTKSSKSFSFTKIGIALGAIIFLIFFIATFSNGLNSYAVKGTSTVQLNAGSGIVVPGQTRPSTLMPYPYQRSLSCSECNYTIPNDGKPNLCLSSGGKSGIPYAHCSNGPQNGETCISCPKSTITPVPTGVCFVRKMCPMIACRVGPDGKAECPPCPTVTVCPPTSGSITPGPIRVESMSTVSPQCSIFQKFLCALGMKCSCNSSLTAQPQ